MAQIELTKYDSTTKKYVAQLTVVDGEKTHTYFCEGTWRPGNAVMVAGALYDQYKAAVNEATKADVEKQEIIAAVSAEIDKMAATTEAK